MNEWDIQVRFGLPEACRHEAAEILCAAFKAKLAPLMGAQHIVAVLERDIQPQAILAAFAEGRLVGMAGLEWGGRQYVRYARATFVRELGPLRGTLKHLASRLALQSERSPGELLVAAVAVRPEVRGRGVGTRLILGAEELARAKGLVTIRLDVVDTNPRARRLYERLGFCPAGEHWLPFLRPIVGFGAYTTMVKRLG